MPRGSTALLDAQGRTIVELGQELAALAEHERPSKVIVVTITDGLENASKHFNLEQIGEMIREQRDKYNWDFVFLGANQDAIKTAAAMNIPLPSAMSYSTSKAGIANHHGCGFPLCGRFAYRPRPRLFRKRTARRLWKKTTRTRVQLRPRGTEGIEREKRGFRIF